MMDPLFPLLLLLLIGAVIAISAFVSSVLTLLDQAIRKNNQQPKDSNATHTRNTPAL